MLFHGGLERLRVGSYEPDTHLTLGTTAYDTLTVRRHGYGRDASLMRIVDHVHELAALGIERAYLAIVPATHDRRAVARKRYRCARLVGHFDAEQLLVRQRMPNSDVLVRARAE